MSWQWTQGTVSSRLTATYNMHTVPAHRHVHSHAIITITTTASADMKCYVGFLSNPNTIQDLVY